MDIHENHFKMEKRKEKEKKKTQTCVQYVCTEQHVKEEGSIFHDCEILILAESTVHIDQTPIS